MTKIIMHVRRSMDRMRFRAAPAALCLFLAAGCSAPLVRSSLSVSTDRWDMNLVKLTAGPDQYMTAGGFQCPRDGRRYVWATVWLRNTLKTSQVFRLDRVYLLCGEARKKPCIIDMGSFVSLRANPAPKLRPGETITRRIAYLLSRGLTPGRLT
jgi:hypothetical protein